MPQGDQQSDDDGSRMQISLPAGSPTVLARHCAWRQKKPRWRCLARQGISSRCCSAAPAQGGSWWHTRTRRCYARRGPGVSDRCHSGHIPPSSCGSRPARSGPRHTVPGYSASACSLIGRPMNCSSSARFSIPRPAAGRPRPARPPAPAAVRHRTGAIRAECRENVETTVRLFQRAAPTAGWTVLAQHMFQRFARALAVISTNPSDDTSEIWVLAWSRDRQRSSARSPGACAPVGHVDEVDDDDAAQVAQPQLAADRHAAFEVGLEDGLSRLRWPTKAPVLTSIVVIASVWSMTR